MIIPICEKALRALGCDLTLQLQNVTSLCSPNISWFFPTLKFARIVLKDKMFAF